MFLVRWEIWLISSFREVVIFFLGIFSVGIAFGVAVCYIKNGSCWNRFYGSRYHFLLVHSCINAGIHALSPILPVTLRF